VRIKDVTFRAVTGAHRFVFRVSGGRLLGKAGAMPVVMLTTTGRRTGRKRATMLTAPVSDEGRVVLVASFGGDPRHPAWFLNLREHPEVTVTMAGRERRMQARVASDAEKAALWPAIVAAYRGYDAYQRRSARNIPVVVLEPYAGGQP